MILWLILHAILARLWMTFNCYCHQVTSSASHILPRYPKKARELDNVKLKPGKTLYPPVYYCRRPNLLSLVPYIFTETKSSTSHLLSGLLAYRSTMSLFHSYQISIHLLQGGRLSTLGRHHLNRNLCRLASNYVLHLFANVHLLVVESFA